MTKGERAKNGELRTAGMGKAPRKPRKIKSVRAKREKKVKSVSAANVGDQSRGIAAKRSRQKLASYGTNKRNGFQMPGAAVVSQESAPLAGRPAKPGPGKANRAHAQVVASG